MSIRAAMGLFATMLVVTGCGGAGGSGKQATLQCTGSTECTVTYPAKARNNQGSSGGPPAEVLGEKTQLYSIQGGEATMRISETEVHLSAGKTQKVGPFTVEAVEITDTSAVVKYTKKA